MKKLISVIAALWLLLSATAVNNSAVDLNTHTFYYGNNKEITVECENISREKMQLIADRIADIDSEMNDGISTCGISCIFGHDLSVGSATETEHNAYSSSPKCLIKKYKLTYCVRSSCDYVKKELVSSSKTSRCHG